MAELILYHHAQGLTPGIHLFAESLREAQHVVHTPDLYDGGTFPDVSSGVAHAKEIGFDAIVQRGVAAATELPNSLVYAGFSLGVLPAQKLTQNRSGARGALLYHAGSPTTRYGSPWPGGVPLQLHAMADDDWCDLTGMQDLQNEVEGAELYVYPGSGHLFADSSVADFEPEAARLLLQRTLEFLDPIE